MTTLAVTSVSSLLCQASTCFRIGSKFRCMRSTPTEIQSMSENDFECFASTGVNKHGTMSPNSLNPISRDIGLELELQQPFGIASENHFALCAGEVNLIEKLHRAIIAHSKTVITAHHHALRAHLFDYEFHNRFRMRDGVIGKPLEIGTRSLGQVL